MDFTFELASPQDDPALRQLLANSAMPGRITVTFEREPNYFLGCGTMGHFWQVVIARHQPSGELAGVLCRGVRPYFVNGQPTDLGYIGQIRIAEKYRSLWLLQRGLGYFRSLHADGRALAYWGVISDENAIARGVLVERRRGSFPTAHQLARIYTLGIILRAGAYSRPLKHAGPAFPGQIERGSPQTLPEIVAFLRREGARKQLFPAYALEDFDTANDPKGGGSTYAFNVNDFLVARQQGQIVGVVGLWDQASFKQTVVQAYDRSLRLLRPFYNLGARLLGAQPLPGTGQHIHSAYASFICIEGQAAHDLTETGAAAWAALLQAVCRLAAERRYAHLMLGLAEGDPLLPIARQYPHIAYHSQLYLGYWTEPGQAGLYSQLDGRIPYTEIAML